ncbi:MAG: TIM barrel protein, partial [Pseudomonadota bacterium]
SPVMQISVQLYSLREASAVDFDEVLQTLAQIGYAGVEPFNLFGKTPEAFRRQVEDLGMQVSSSHYPWSNRTPVNEVVETTQALGLNRAAGGFMPDDFADMDAINRTIDTTRQLVADLGRHDITLCLHNHYWEYAEVEGQIAYHYVQDAIPELEFEIDTYWAANFGIVDPVAAVQRVRARCPLLHIKDGPLQKDASNVAVGAGSMPIAEVIAAADPAVLEWVIVELDQCDGDMMQAVADSHTYLAKRN